MEHYFKLGYKGVNVVPSLVKVYTDDRLMYPIYASAWSTMSHRHPHRAVPGRRLDVHDYNFVLPLDRVATDFPDLVIIASHLGIPWWAR
jgi:predicted TIM-barrel fold metal-dependent hydrolase